MSFGCSLKRFPKQNEIQKTQLTDLGFQVHKGFFKKHGYVRALWGNQDLQLHLPHHHGASEQFHPGSCHLQSFCKEVMVQQQLALDKTKGHWKSIYWELHYLWKWGQIKTSCEAIDSTAFLLNLSPWCPNRHKVKNLEFLLHSLLLSPKAIKKT